MKSRNWFWGILFILAAVAIIAVQTGSFERLGVSSLLISIFLLAIIIDSIVRRNFFGIFLPLAFLYMVLWKILELPYIGHWILIVSSVMISIGFSIIFGKSHKSKCEGYCRNEDSTRSESLDDNNPDVSVRFGSAVKYLHADDMKSGRFSISFGELEIFFDQVQLNSEGAEIFVDCSLGSLILNIPRHWRVKENIHVSLGEVKSKSRLATPAEDAPKLTISGNLHLGAIEIRYI